VTDDTEGDETAFHSELEAARELLATDDVSAFHVGVVHDDRVDTAFAQHPAGDRDEELQALTLLATHLRLVAQEADAAHDAVAAQAAQIAGRLEESRPLSPPDDDTTE